MQASEKTGRTLAQTLVTRHYPELATQLANVPLQQRICRPGQILSQREDYVQHVYVVTSGCLKRVMNDHRGDQHIDEFYFEGDLVGLDNLRDRRKSASVEACDVVGAVAVPVSLLLHGDVPEATCSVMRELIDELTRARALALYVAHKCAAARVAWFLCSVLGRRHQRNSALKNLDMVLPMRRCDIANFLGLAPETISRELSALSRERVIEANKRNVQVLDLDRLSSIADVEKHPSSNSGRNAKPMH